MDQFSNKGPNEDNTPDKNQDKQPDNEMNSEFPAKARGALIAYGETQSGEEKIIGALPISIVPHGDHFHAVPEGPGIGPVESELFNLKTPEDVFRALRGDSGPSTNTTRVGYTPKYGSGWERVFGNENN